MNINSREGFTIIELMIVLTILAVILAIAAPNYLRSREESRRNTCIANLKQISSAVDQWVMEYKVQPGTVPSDSDEEDIYAYLKGARPKCPSGGIYTIHQTGGAEQVTCSLSDKGHTL